MAWLPPPAESVPRAHRPWCPPGLGDADTRRLTYVVVDEMLGAAVGLTLSPWPPLDDQGRLRFAESERRTLGADRTALERFLARHRLPSELGARPLRVGDVFAVTAIEPALAAVEQELAAPRKMEPFLAPEEWIEPPVHDVSADARDEAKTSFYSAVAPLLAPAEAALLEEIVERPPGPPELPPPQQPPARPWWRRNLRWIVATTVLFAAGIGAGVAVGGVGDSTATDSTVTVETTITETTTNGQTVIETATETTTVTDSTTATETVTTTEPVATTETTVITETTTTTVTVPVTVTVFTSAPGIR